MRTLNEGALPGYIDTGFHLLLVPGATPPEIVGRLNSEITKALESSHIKERLTSLGLDPAGGSPADCTKRIQQDIARWAPVVKAGGARAD